MAALGAVAEAQTVAPGPYYATPSWDQTLTCTAAATCPRFVVLSNFNDEAVLDRETGLVWQRTPSVQSFTWFDGLKECRKLTIGNRRGWRMPTLDELASLLDPSQGGVKLPPGHPFQGVDINDFFWTATTLEFNTAFAWLVIPSTNDFGTNTKAVIGDQLWCVRGGSPADNPR
jgi:hypothetical protein